MLRLHRCPFMFIKTKGHGCWQVQKALDETGTGYELVKVPMKRSNREEVIRLTGQPVVPVIELDDGTAIREDGKALAERIRAGELENRGPSTGPLPTRVITKSADS